MTASTLSAPSSVLDPGALDRLVGAVRRVGADETAFAHREADSNLIIVSLWQDPTAAQANVRWVRDLREGAPPSATEGVDVNELGTEGTDRVRAAYGEEKYARLAAQKVTFDPANRFHVDQNIAPTVRTRFPDRLTR